MWPFGLRAGVRLDRPRGDHSGIEKGFHMMGSGRAGGVATLAGQWGASIRGGGTRNNPGNEEASRDAGGAEF